MGLLQFKYIYWLSLIAFFLSACVPEEEIEFRRIKNVGVKMDGNLILTGEAEFYNPNAIRMKLKKVNIHIYVEDQKVGDLNQKLNLNIPSKSKFDIPLEVKLATQEKGFLGSVLNVLGGKKTTLKFKGSLTLIYKGLPVKFPIQHEEELRIRL